MKAISLGEGRSTCSYKSTSNNNNKFNKNNNKINPEKKHTKAMFHKLINEMDISDGEENNNESNNADNIESDNNEDSTLLANSATCKNVSPDDLRNLLSSKKKEPPDKKKVSVNNAKASKSCDEVTLNGKVCICANNAVTYSTSNIDRVHNQSLVDRGANRGVAGEDARVIFCDTHRKVDFRGIDNHGIASIPIVSDGGVTTTLQGEMIIIMHQHACCGKGKTVYSLGQIEWFKNDVNNELIKVGGLQRIIANDSCVIPINIKNGLPCMPLSTCASKSRDCQRLSQAMVC